MDQSYVIFDETPQLEGGRMVLAFDGWMDGGEVSTGTVEYLIERLKAREIAEIDREPFYLYNFPGPMDVSALFRPHTRVADGVIETVEMPTNLFFVDEPNNLVLFQGKEPNIHWESFAEAVFEAARRFGVTTIYFVGSFAGMVPHTRDPRLYGSVSSARLRGEIERFGLLPGNYEGPCGLTTLMLYQAEEAGFEMLSLVAEIPAYIQGRNARSIESVTRKLTSMLGVDVDLDDLRAIGDEWEHKLDEAVGEREELIEHIEKLEHDYDNQVFDTQMGDLKNWLEQRGIRVD